MVINDWRDLSWYVTTFLRNVGHPERISRAAKIGESRVFRLVNGVVREIEKNSSYSRALLYITKQRGTYTRESRGRSERKTTGEFHCYLDDRFLDPAYFSGARLHTGKLAIPTLVNLFSVRNASRKPEGESRRGTVATLGLIGDAAGQEKNNTNARPENSRGRKDEIKTVSG